MLSRSRIELKSRYCPSDGIPPESSSSRCLPHRSLRIFGVRERGTEQEVKMGSVVGIFWRFPSSTNLYFLRQQQNTPLTLSLEAKNDRVK